MMSEEEKNIHVESDTSEEKDAVQRLDEEIKSEKDKPHQWYRLFYAKQGDIRFLSHLEMLQVFFQAFRRAGIKQHFSQGFNPVPKASFSAALPVGTESLAEYLDVDLREAITDESGFLLRINRQLPSGIRILSVAGVPDKNTDAAVRNLTCYRVSLDRDLSTEARDALKSFMDSDSCVITKIRKGRQRLLDIRKQVEGFAVLEKNSLELVLHSQEGKAAGKPVEILKAVFSLTDEECLNLKILKVWSKSAS